MKINIRTNLPQVAAALKKAPGQVRFAAMLALNSSAEKARVAVRDEEMPRVFDRPTPWVVNSLFVKKATKTNLEAHLAYKDRTSSRESRSMIEPHVFGGKRHYKAMEARLMRMGLLPAGWSVVPGAGAKLDTYGNVSPGQITTLLNVLGTYTESGFNKANINTVKRLAKGSVKKNVYGFAYWVNQVGSTRARHLPPGVYQRVTTGFGSSLKPVLIFVSRVNYEKSFDFFGFAEAAVREAFPAEFEAAFDKAMSTAVMNGKQGELL